MRRKVGRTLLTLVLLGLALSSRPSYASVLGLRPLPPDPPEHFADVGRDSLLQRASALEARMSRLTGEQAYQSRLELCELYFATGLFKHRGTALELCEQLRRENEGRPESLLLEARFRSSMEDLSGAIHLLRRYQKDHRKSAAFYYALGYYYFQKGLLTLDTASFRSARRYFLEATRLDRSQRRHRLALAASAVLVRDAKITMIATSIDGVGKTAVLPALLLRATALHWEGKNEAAHYTFEEAFERMIPEWRASFGTGAIFLDPQGRDPASVRRFWIGVDPHPTQVANARQVEFWVRMTQADLLFGSYEKWTPGWTTQPGSAWARWGAPDALIYQPPGAVAFMAITGPSPPDLRSPHEMVGAFSPRLEDFRAPEPSHMDFDPNEQRMRWFYNLGDDSFALTFLSTSLRSSWILTTESSITSASLVHDAPMLFRNRRRAPSFSVNVAAAGFLTADGKSRLEIAMGIDPDRASVSSGQSAADTDSIPYQIDWAIFDSKGRRIDHDTVNLGLDHRRSLLLKRVDPGSAALEEATDPLIAKIAMLLPPDRYHLALETHHPPSKEYHSAQLDLDLSILRSNELSLSDLQITDTYKPWDGQTPVPPEFLKYAQILIPRASLSFPKGHRETFVYYEISGLSQDQSGQAHFSVIYELEAIRMDLESKKEGAQRRLQIQRHEFPEEVRNFSEGGKVIKGTRVDLGHLSPGSWLLRVIVNDHLSHRESFRELEIEIEP